MMICLSRIGSDKTVALESCQTSLQVSVSGLFISPNWGDRSTWYVGDISQKNTDEVHRKLPSEQPCVSNEIVEDVSPRYQMLANDVAGIGSTAVEISTCCSLIPYCCPFVTSRSDLLLLDMFLLLGLPADFAHLFEEPYDTPTSLQCLCLVNLLQFPGRNREFTPIQRIIPEWARSLFSSMPSVDPSLPHPTRKSACWLGTMTI